MQNFNKKQFLQKCPYVSSKKICILKLADGQEQEERIRGEQDGHVHQPLHPVPGGQQRPGAPGPQGPQDHLCTQLQKVYNLAPLEIWSTCNRIFYHEV